MRQKLKNRRQPLGSHPGICVQKLDKKGFTLVELIVTLAVVAILAALTVPAGLSYIDENHKKQCQVNKKALMAYYTSATVDFEGLTLEEYLTNLKKFKEDHNASLIVGSEVLKNNEDTILRNNLKLAEKIKCPSGGDYKEEGKDEITCTNHP